MKKKYLLLLALFMFSTSQAGTIGSILYKIKKASTTRMYNTKHSGLIYKYFTSKFMRDPELIKSIKANNMTKFDELLNKKNVDINYKDKNKNTPLDWASYLGREKMTKKLLLKGADVNMPNCSGHTPLMQAADNKKPNMVSILLDSSADVHAQTNGTRWTALHYATKNNDVATLRLLLNAGAKIEARNSYGETSLKIATNEYNYDAMSCLLRHGANYNATSNNGRTPLFTALVQDFVVGVLLLRGYGATEYIMKEEYRKKTKQTWLARSTLKDNCDRLWKIENSD